MNGFEVVIYDVDGTLIDTREWILGAFEYTATQFGYNAPPREQLNRLIGLSLGEIYETICPGEDLEQLFAVHRKHQRARIPSVHAYRGARQLLKHNSNRKQAIVTSRAGSPGDTLKNAGIAGFFDVEVTGNDVGKYKPHPEGINLVLATLEIDPARAIYLGDAHVDMEAAKRAHVRAVGITHGFGVENDLRQYGADHIVHSLDEFGSLLSGLEA